MKIKSALATELSGSLGGLVASHNRGGIYLRARAIPVNPNTPQQQEIRSLVALLTGLWTNVLTPLQRAGWDNYAEQVPLPDRLGEPRNVGGIAMYVRTNTFGIGGGVVRKDDAPIIFNLGGFTPTTFTNLIESAQTFNLNFQEEDEWVSEDGAMLRIFTSQPQNLSINYFKGPYRKADAIAGDNAIPPTTPFTSGVAFPFVDGQRVFVRVNVIRNDGRLSTEQFVFANAIA